ncbi:hypothetical protein RHMOL_Rhmol02G0167800 [Rhododendron molle]|uniref:Uncharacterized protein n=1 Tax=Rhododendron molle TaxID=49168 RepID=A0ACC0PQT5_RHOML|nr:hypothetical protein RHMOL_Rhmol02G0167800 [Rhododendron molle]
MAANCCYYHAGLFCANQKLKCFAATCYEVVLLLMLLFSSLATTLCCRTVVFSPTGEENFYCCFELIKDVILLLGYANMSTRGEGRGGRGGHGMTGHGITPHGVTTRSVHTPVVQFMPNNGVTTRSGITPDVQSMPNNDPEQNSSAALHVSESEQPNESLTPYAPITKQVRGRTKGLALAKIRRRGEKVKLGFSRMLGQPTSDNEDDLTRYTTKLGIIVRQFAPLQAKSRKAVPQYAKEMCIAHIREKCGKYKDSRSKPRNHHVAGSKAFYKVKDHLKKLKDVQDQAMANGSVPLTDEELSCTVFGPKPGYIRGLGHGPNSLTKSGQTSRAQLIRDVEEARKETTAAQKKCEEALVDAAQARKNTEQLAETIANMQS